jgi:hypothetical protein
MTKKSFISFLKMGVLILIAIFALALIVGYGRKTEIEIGKTGNLEKFLKKVGEQPAEINLDICGKLTENCLNENCSYFENYCKWATLQEPIEECFVYQCPGPKKGSPEVYVSEVKFKKSKFILRRVFLKEEKSPQEIEKEITPFLEKCKGKIEVLDKEDCSKYKIKVETAGDCKISNFMGTFDNKNYQTFAFSKEKDFYILTIPDCPNLKELIAVGERGILIK